VSVLVPEGGYGPAPKPDEALPKSGRSRTGKTIPAKVRQAVYERAGWLCELGCGQRAVHLHHRKLRSQGGQHVEANLLAVDLRCHEQIHAQPARSLDHGWIVASWADPAAVPFTSGGER